MRWLIVLVLVFVFAGCRFGDSKSDDSDSGQIELHYLPHDRVCKANIRGLFLVNDSIGWASGTNGTFLRMTDGIHWVCDSVVGYTHLDFRDIHAFDADNALLMAAGEEGRIIRTADGGKTWVEVYTRLDSGIFLDGMDFDGRVGYCFGDPINGKLVVIRSEDEGQTWTEIAVDECPEMLAQEAAFAASGTSILFKDGQLSIGTGGDSIARFVSYSDKEGWQFHVTPLRSEEGCGIFSLTKAGETLVAVGGCYLDSTNTAGNCAISTDGGKNWEPIVDNGPLGYRSVVAYSSHSDLLVASGRTGVEFSLDRGRTWTSLTEEGYYTCALADSSGWLMGKRGKMARLSW